MKTTSLALGLLAAASTLFTTPQAAAQANGIEINIGGSNAAVVNTQTLRINNIEHANRRYVLDLEWNPQALVFVPVRLAEQSAAGLLCNAPLYSSGTRVGTLMLQNDPTNRAIQVSVVNDGPNDPWIFSLYNWRFIHNQKAYSLTVRPSDLDASTALMNLTTPSSFSTRSMSRGERFVVGTINNLPNSFDFNMPLTSVTYASQTTSCQ